MKPPAWLATCDQCARDVLETSNPTGRQFCPHCFNANLTYRLRPAHTWRGIPYEQPDLFSEREES